MSRWQERRLSHLWLRHKEMTLSMSASLTSLRPSKATSALAARLTTISPRRPSTSRREQISEMSSCMGGQSVLRGHLRGCNYRKHYKSHGFDLKELTCKVCRPPPFISHQPAAYPRCGRPPSVASWPHLAFLSKPPVIPTGAHSAYMRQSSPPLHKCHWPYTRSI